MIRDPVLAGLGGECVVWVTNPAVGHKAVQGMVLLGETCIGMANLNHREHVSWWGSGVRRVHVCDVVGRARATICGRAYAGGASWFAKLEEHGREMLSHGESTP